MYSPSTGFYGVGSADMSKSSNQSICPAGSYCVNGKKFACPDNQFQTILGSTACQNCPPAACDKGLTVTNSGGTCDPATGLYTCEDITPPRIYLNGRADMTVEIGAVYKEPGAFVNDTRDSGSDLSKRIIITGSVNSTILGTYVLAYDFKDAAGNAAATAKRTVRVVDTTKPYLLLIGPPSVKVVQGLEYVDSGVYVNDTGDSLVKNKIVTTGLPLDTRKVGLFDITFTVIDASLNRAEVIRRVTVVDAGVENQAQLAANTAYKEALSVYKGDTTRAKNAAQAAYLEAGGQMDPSAAASTAKSTQESEKSASSAPIAAIIGAVAGCVLVLVLIIVVVKRRRSG
jgi:hypothetical protein